MTNLGLRRSLCVLPLLFLACGGAEGASDVASSDSDLSATLTEVKDFGDNPGHLKMQTFVPPGLPKNAPLVVAMHGCGGSAGVYAEPSGWTYLAKKYSFALVLPSADSLMRCFNVQKPEDQLRGQGEAASIKEMVDWMKAHHPIDSTRVFVTGFSSGAEMTDVMLGAYPDVFAAGAAVAGIPYLCATDEISFGKCTSLGGRDLTPNEWGDRVRAANPGKWKWPRMSIWHGTKDPIVASINLTEQMEQWTNLNGIDQIPDVEDEIHGYPHKVYLDEKGEARVETIALTDHGHLLPVEPGTGPEECGTSSLFTMSRDIGVCSSYFIARWFGIAP
jgi:poly(hydroxyalkanoate) depolymerase family esterase